MIEQPLHQSLRLRAGHGHIRALRAQLPQKLRNAHIDLRVVKHAALVCLAEMRVERIGLLGRHAQIALRRIKNRRADKLSGQLVRKRANPHPLRGSLQRPADAPDRIGDCSVKIK